MRPLKSRFELSFTDSFITSIKFDTLSFLARSSGHADSSKQYIFSVSLSANIHGIQNLVQGRLVNGTKGKVVNFLTTGAARRQLVEIAKVDEKKAAWSAPAKDPVEGEDSGSTPPPDDEEPGIMKWPVVEFEGYGRLLLPPMGFTVVSVFGEMEAQRDQVSLPQIPYHHSVNA